MPQLQTLIHGLEVGGGMRYVRFGVSIFLLVAAVLAYNWRSYKNMSTREGMDAAQVARNLAEGKGFTTSFIRPFSIYLLARKAHPAGPAGSLVPDKGAARLDAHPDLANPPLYPVVLAAVMKVLPFQFTIPASPAGFWRVNGQWARYQPDFLIAIFNKVLFLLVILLVFALARRFFDPAVAWVSAVLLLGTELYWQFSDSGLSTMLLLLIFTLLTWCLVLLEERATRPAPNRPSLLPWAALAGLLTGLGTLTRYSFGWLILPVLGFLLLVGNQRRVIAALAALSVFSVVLAPWVTRNVSLCGEPFGIPTFSAAETTYAYPADRLERNLSPDVTDILPNGVGNKTLNNLHDLLANDLPKLGGSWVSGFFLVGLLLQFRRAGVSRLRYFIIGSLIVLVLAQAVGRTGLSEASPGINSENLLVLVGPLVLVYGVSLFFTLLEQIQFPFPQLRYGAIILFSLIACLPFLLKLRMPMTIPLAYPPYHPRVIQAASTFTRPDEIMMSDIPWAVAWYGHSQCAWLTLDNDSTFYALNDYYKPVRALYLTPVTLDDHYQSQMLKARGKSWGEFTIVCAMRRKDGLNAPPEGFPMKYWQPGYWPEQFLVTFREKPINDL